MKKRRGSQRNFIGEDWRYGGLDRKMEVLTVPLLSEKESDKMGP